MPLTFLSPWYLLAGLAVAIPVIIHLLQRRREVEISFSMVKFILLARKRSSRRMKLRKLLLLALRMAAILLLAFILARPVVPSPALIAGKGGGGHTAVIFDNSLSMTVVRGGRSLFESQRQLAKEFAFRSGGGGRFALITAVPPRRGGIKPSWTGAEGLAAGFADLEVEPREGDFTVALETAYRLLREVDSIDKRIVIFTDLARGGWTDFSLLAVAEADPAIPVRIYRVGDDDPPEGAGILTVARSAESRLAGEENEVTARLVNWGPGATLKVELWLDGRSIDRKVVDITPGEEGEIVFRSDFRGEGNHRGELRIEEDSYHADDRRYFGFALSPTLRVLLVDGDSRLSLTASETFFLQEALRSDDLSLAEPVVVRVTGVEELPTLDLGKFDVVVLANVPAVDDGAPLADFVSAGGGLIVFWGDNCRPEEYRRSLPSLLPARFGDRSAAPMGRPFRLGEVDVENDIFSLFRLPSAGTFATAKFRVRAKVLEVQPGATVPARFADGEPWMVASSFGRGKVLLFSSSADLEWNDLPTKPVFVPLLRRSILAVSDRLAGEVEGDSTVGETRLFEESPALAYANLEVVAPGGAVERLEFLPEGEVARAVFRGTEEPGFYTARRPGGEEVFAVNVPSGESDLRTLGGSDLRSRFQQINVAVFSVGEGKEVEEFFQSGTRSLTRNLFLALFFLLLVEMLVAGPRLSRKSSALKA